MTRVPPPNDGPSVIEGCGHIKTRPWVYDRAAWCSYECWADARAAGRIADMPTEPRPDGTFNYDRAALIQIAGMALGRGL